METDKGWGGDEKSSVARDTKGVPTEREASIESGLVTVAQPCPQKNGTARESGGDETLQQVSMHRHSASTNGARPKCGASRKYVTLAPEGLVGDTDSVGGLGIRDDPEELEAMETKEMETRDL